MPYTDAPDTYPGSADPAPGSSILSTLAGDTLTDACDVLRRTATRDAAGGVSFAWAVIAAAVPCRFEKVTRYAEVEMAGATRGLTAWRALLPLSTDVTPKDRLQKGGEVWEVTETDRGRTDAATLTAMLVKIEPAA